VSQQPRFSDVIPAPARHEASREALAPGRLEWVAGADASHLRLAEFAVRYLEPALGRRLVVLDEPPADSDLPGLQLESDPGLPQEHYHLTVAGDGLRLAAASRPGYVRGLATLFQLVAAGAASGPLPGGTITDGPAFPWRGLLLDSGRHFRPVDEVLRVLDRLALYKLNLLHWHLTEDQGWRLEVPGLPRLTEVGAWRLDQRGDRHGGFYTAADVRRVLDYAANRGITVVPEIEMPGHSQAALAAYPELSCTGGPFAVQSQWGVFPDIYCAGNDDVFAFLEQVLSHVLELFPSPFIHVGGDEAPRERWRACPRCQQRLRDEGLQGEHELQSWFIRRMGHWLAARGRRLVGWDEILDGGLAGTMPGAVVQSWRGYDGARAAIAAGHDTVVSPTSHCYLDYDPGALDLAQVVSFDPVPPGTHPLEALRVLGGAANLWTEYVPDWRAVDRQLFPRLPAVAEALWTNPAVRDVAAFHRRLRRQEPSFAALDIRPGASSRPLRVEATWDHAEERHLLRWSLTGALAAAMSEPEPQVRCALVPGWRLAEAGPTARPEHLKIPADRSDRQLEQILFATRLAAWQPAPAAGLSVTRSDRALTAVLQWFVDDLPCGAPEVVELCRHLALGRPVRLESPPGTAESARLTDGVLGTWRQDDGRWFGWEAVDLEAIVYLERPAAVGGVLVRFLQDANAGVFPPLALSVQVSADGRQWHHVGACACGTSDRVQDKLVVPFLVELPADADAPAGVSFVRVHAGSRRTCPDWHPEAGRPCRLAADEIIIREREPRAVGG
jgi:hexosaminidase